MTQDKETTHRLLDAVIQLDDFCYLIGMSEEYHCQYPVMLSQIQEVKRALAAGVAQGLTPSGRIDAAQLAGAFPDDFDGWQSRISAAVDRVLPLTQHLLLPFPGKGVVEHAVDSGYQRLVQQQVNAETGWLSQRIDKAPSVFSKMVLQQAFCEGLVESSVNRRVLLHCAGLYDALGHPPTAENSPIQADLLTLHSALGFHAERVVATVEERADGTVTRVGYTRAIHDTATELLILSSEEPVLPSHQLEMVAHQVAIPETPETTRQLCLLAKRLIEVPAPTQSAQLIADALAFRIAQLGAASPRGQASTTARPLIGAHLPSTNTPLNAGA